MSVCCSKSIGKWKYNLISVRFNKISKIFLCVYIFLPRWRTDWKRNRDQTYSCPRDWGLSTSLMAPLKPLEPSHHYHIDGFKGGGYQWCRDTSVSRTANVILFWNNPTVKFFVWSARAIESCIYVPRLFLCLFACFLCWCSRHSSHHMRYLIRLFYVFLRLFYVFLRRFYVFLRLFLCLLCHFYVFLRLF